MKSCRIISVTVVALAISFPFTVHALGPTLPSDMFEFTTSGSLVGDNGYYFIDPQMMGNPGQTTQYAMILNGQGEVVQFLKPRGIPMLSNWQPIDSAGVYTYAWGNTNYPSELHILDNGFDFLDSLSSINPFNDSLQMDGHEFHLEADGSMWTLWRHNATIDMSEYVTGGNPNALLIGHDIERWDADGNLVWAWRSHDHIDQLPYTGITNPGALVLPEIEYLHVNSFDLTPDGDVLVSARRLSCIFKIDYETGNVEWILGGGPLNQFEFTGNAGEHPLSFNSQHDARMLEDGTITVFDNGTQHQSPRAFTREYVIDLENMEAELTWYYTHPTDIFSAGALGSFRHLPDGNRLIGWGGQGPSVQVTLLDPSDVLLMELDFTFGGFQNPASYRAVWSADAPVADLPVVSEVIDEGQGTIELVCNWWGHESAVEMYELYVGSDWDPPLLTTTDTGVFVSDQYDPMTGYVVRCRALDGDGIPVSDYSPRLLINEQYLDISEDMLDISALNPSSFTLFPAYPNPFNSSAIVSVELPFASSITVQLVNVNGQLVSTLTSGFTQAGTHTFTLDATDIASGVYFLSASIPNQAPQMQKLVLIR